MKIEMLGNSTKEEIEKNVKIIAAAGKLSNFNGNVFEVLESCDNYKSNLKFIKRVIDKGHESIIEHDYFIFALADVTPIVEQILIECRIGASFTIKSRREVDFSTVGYYIPEFRNSLGSVHPNNEDLKVKYINHMNRLFKEYSYFKDNEIDVEDARYVLPYSYHSNIIMGMDARELKKLVISLLYGKYSNVSELKEVGQILMNEIESKVPYLKDVIMNKANKPEEFFNFERYKKDKNLEINILEKPILLNNTSNCDDMIFLSFLMNEYQCNQEKAEEILNDLSLKDPKFKSDLMKYIVMKDVNRELEQINFQFQIPISLAVLTHLTRHRLHSLMVPDFVPIWNLDNYATPSAIQKHFPDRYNEIYKDNMEMYQYFKNQGVIPEDLIYFYLSGNMCNVLTTMNARTLAWICERRLCNNAQKQIRDIFTEIATQVKEVAPIYGEFLGPSCIIKGICPEGSRSCKKKVRKSGPSDIFNGQLVN